MRESILCALCLATLISGCALQSSDAPPEEANTGEFGQALDGSYRYTAARYRVRDWTSSDPNGNVSFTYPQLYVPEVASRLLVQTVGGSGDLDLEVDFADGGGFECLSANAGTEQSCQYSDPPAGFWSTDLRLWDPTTGVRLIQSYALPLPYEAEVFRGELELDTWQAFGPFPVAPGSQLSVELEAQHGDPNLYVRWDADPDLDNWDCRPFEGRFASEVCDVPVPDGAVAAHVSLHNASKPRNVQTRYKLTVISAEVL